MEIFKDLEDQHFTLYPINIRVIKELYIYIYKLYPYVIQYHLLIPNNMTYALQSEYQSEQYEVNTLDLGTVSDKPWELK